MADEDKTIKELPIKTSASDDDDIIIEDDSPTTYRIKASDLKSYITAEVQEQVTGALADIQSNTNLITQNASDISELNTALADLTQSNAYSHNALYRGKSLGSSITSTQASAISDGTFDDLYIGDYWTISSANYRIGSFNYLIRTGSSASLTTNHALIVRDSNFYTAPMNSTNTTAGGYIGSAMYTGESITVDGTAYTGLKNAISTIETVAGSYLLTFEAYFTNAVTSGYPSGGEWVTGVKAALMTENMVYGGPIREQMSYGGTNVSNARIEKNILPLFLYAPYYQNIRASYWLRGVVSSTSFARVASAGSATGSDASGVYGVRPYFLIS